MLRLRDIFLLKSLLILGLYFLHFNRIEICIRTIQHVEFLLLGLLRLLVTQRVAHPLNGAFPLGLLLPID
jgi:hypothetical protein